MSGDISAQLNVAAQEYLDARRRMQEASEVVERERVRPEGALAEFYTEVTGERWPPAKLSARSR